MNDTIKTILGAAGIVIGAIVLFVIGVAIFGDPPTKADRDKETAKMGIESCWKAYERKSLTPDEKIGIAKFCEGLEADAKAK